MKTCSCPLHVGPQPPERSAQYFYRDTTKPSGLMSWCRECVQRRRKEQRHRMVTPLPKRPNCRCATHVGPQPPRDHRYFTRGALRDGLASWCRECQKKARLKS